MEACCSARYLLNLSFLCFRVIKFLWLGLHGAGLLLAPPSPTPPKLPPKGRVGVSWSSTAPPPSAGGLYRGVIAGQRGSLREAVWLHIQRVFCGWLWVFAGATPAWCVVGVRLLFPGNSYLPGCVHILRLTAFSVCLCVHVWFFFPLASTDRWWLFEERKNSSGGGESVTGATFPSECCSQCTHRLESWFGTQRRTTGGGGNKKNLQSLQRDRSYQPESLNYPVYREKQQSRTAAQTCCLGFLRDADRNKSEASGAAVSNPNPTCTALAAQ